MGTYFSYLPDQNQRGRIQTHLIFHCIRKNDREGLRVSKLLQGSERKARSMCANGREAI